MYLGSVTHGRDQYHSTPHTPPIPSGESHLLGGKHREMQSPKFSGTYLSFVSVKWDGQA